MPREQPISERQYKWGTELMAFRVSAGMTQEELTELLSCSDSTVSRMERGCAKPGVTVANELAYLFPNLRQSPEGLSARQCRSQKPAQEEEAPEAVSDDRQDAFILVTEEWLTGGPKQYSTVSEAEAQLVDKDAKHLPGGYVLLQMAGRYKVKAISYLTFERD